ncbi:uncharacterized protein LOC143841773 isoform X1 [Paroedura picta]|uniref:uncharacterized protein LOC143841773 isoform X1 n=1 Tax=Paroedura picta TaxID=143630 RepID=UPI00405648FF
MLSYRDQRSDHNSLMNGILPFHTLKLETFLQTQAISESPAVQSTACFLRSKSHSCQECNPEILFSSLVFLLRDANEDTESLGIPARTHYERVMMRSPTSAGPARWSSSTRFLVEAGVSE